MPSSAISTTTVDRVTARWAPLVLRWTAGLLWLGNIKWKVPPDFGRTAGSCRALCGFVADGVSHPVLPGAPWAFEHVVGPHLWAFGWITVLSEGALAVLLLSGRHVRLAAVLGIAQSIGVLAAVGNTPGEWAWSYLLMIALHLAVLASVPHERVQPSRTMALATAAFGAAMVATHAGEGLTGTGYTLFDRQRDLPDELGRNLFGGSVALGLLLVMVAGVTWLLMRRLEARQLRSIGWGLTVAGTALALTYSSDGLLVGLGSTTTTACMVAALGLAIAVTPPARPTNAP